MKESVTVTADVGAFLCTSIEEIESALKEQLHSTLGAMLARNIDNVKIKLTLKATCSDEDN